MLFKTTITTFLTPKSLKLFSRLSIRYLQRNKDKWIKQSFDFLNDDISNEIVSFLNYKHIIHHDINSYLYIILYELFYISISIQFNPKQQNKIIEKGLIHLMLYIVFKENIILDPHNLNEMYKIDEYEAL